MVRISGGFGRRFFICPEIDMKNEKPRGNSRLSETREFVYAAALWATEAV
jgi:hypothetical protein